MYGRAFPFVSRRLRLLGFVPSPLFLFFLPLPRILSRFSAFPPLPAEKFFLRGGENVGLCRNANIGKGFRVRRNSLRRGARRLRGGSRVGAHGRAHAPAFGQPRHRRPNELQSGDRRARQRAYCKGNRRARRGNGGQRRRHRNTVPRSQRLQGARSPSPSRPVRQKGVPVQDEARSRVSPQFGALSGGSYGAYRFKRRNPRGVYESRGGFLRPQRGFDNRNLFEGAFVCRLLQDGGRQNGGFFVKEALREH